MKPCHKPRPPFGRCNVAFAYLALLCLLPHPAGANSKSPHPFVVVYGGTGTRTVDKAIELGVDALVPSVNWYSEHDFMKRITERCHRHGIKVLPSYATASDGYHDKQHEFATAHPQWWEKRRDGRLVNTGVHVGLSFGVPEVRRFKVETLTRYVRDYNLDGVALDYTRFFERTCGYHETIVEAFKEETGRDPHAIPNEDPQWMRFRARYVTTFVHELRESLNAVGSARGRPVEVWACVNPDPEHCIAYSMQDWQTWVDEGLVDAVLSMIYERDTNNSIRQAEIANAACADKVPHIPMIAPYGGFLTSDEMVLDASLKMLKTGTGAVGYYRDDTMFDYGVWDAVGRVCKWKKSQIEKTPVNYLLNPGFEFEFERWATADPATVEVVEDPVHSGTRSLALGPGATVRQLIDRGFFGGRRTLIISLWAHAAKWPARSRLFLDVNTRDAKKGEQYFRVPVKLGRKSSWQRFEARLPIVDSTDLRWMIVSLVAEAEDPVDPVDPVDPEARIVIDDLTVHLDAAAVNPKRFAISERKAAEQWKPAGNLLLGQPAMCSSFWEAGFEPGNAVDGDLSSDDYGRHAAWHSQRPAENQWLQIYLPAPQAIERIRLLNASAQAAYRTLRYRVEMSLDGEGYRQVAEGNLPDDATTWTEHRFEPVRAKYVRFVGVLGYNREYAVGLKEIEAYGPD